MPLNPRRTLRQMTRAALLTAAFGAGVWLCDAMLRPLTLRADDATPTSQPAELIADDAPPATRPAIPADVKAILDQVTLAYADLPLDVRGTLTEDFDVAGILRKTRTPIRATIRSASTFRHDAGEDVSIIGDGVATHVYDAAGKRYVTRPLGATGGRPTIDGDALAILAMQDPAAAVAVTGDAATALVPAGATGVRMLDGLTVGGATFDRVEVTADAIRAEFWIDRATHRIASSVVDYAKQLTAAGAAAVTRAVVTIHYDAVGPATAPSMVDARFTFEPPKGASEASVAAGAIGAGRPAPAFALADLDGKPVTLAQQKGHVVVLDFWATWCGPCRAGMPHLAEAAKTYADRGVRVFAINREEEVATIRAFLAKESLTGLRVLLDPDGKVAAGYRVTGIPQTVVIDASGRVTKVIVGFGPNTGDELNTAIEQALSAAKLN